jgi:hypothetical protein
MFLGGDAEDKPTPVRELYSVFRRSATPSDLYVRQLARRDTHGGLIDEEPDTPPHIRSAFREQIGTPLYDDTRLIVGTTERGIYAMPTTADAICLGSFPDGGGGCGQPGPHGVKIGWDDASGDSPFLLYGIVGDDVSSVEVVVDGRRREAELGENGYRLVLGRRPQLKEAILRLHGGATWVLPLPKPRPL